MKILHTSDWHVGRKMRGRDRSEEHRAVLDEIVGVATDNQVDLTIVAGDVFDSGSPVAASEEIVWSTLLGLAEVSPVVVVAGNHDSPHRLDAVAPLLAMGRITALGSPRGPDRGGLVRIGEVNVALLPFLSQRTIVKAEHIMGSDPDQNAGLYEERLRRVVARLTEDMAVETVNILVGHLTVVGAQTGVGSVTPTSSATPCRRVCSPDTCRTWRWVTSIASSGCPTPAPFGTRDPQSSSISARSTTARACWSWRRSRAGHRRSPRSLSPRGEGW